MDKTIRPTVDLFRGVGKWDGKTDHIEHLTTYLEIEDKTYFLRHFKKWLVRVIASSLKPDYFNKQMLLFVGRQNNGKTSFQRFLCPPALRDYYSEEMIQGKDELITLTQSFLILLDELSKLDRSGVEHVKQLMTKTRIRFRQPYAKTQSTFFSHTSFMGNTNKTEFLRDETGSVRFLCFSLNKIDFAYSKEVHIDNIWAQAYTLYKNGFDYDISRNEEIEIQEYNRRYQALTHEQEMLLRLFTRCEKNDPDSTFLTSTEIANEISLESRLQVKPENVGKGLRFLNFVHATCRRENSPYPIKGYFVKRINRPEGALYKDLTYSPET